MTADFPALVVRVQLAASVAILALLGLRRLRLPLDPDTRIWLWLIPPLAAFVSLVPADVMSRRSDWPDAAPVGPAPPWLSAVLAIWLVGAAAALARTALLHLAFLREVRRRRAGPAVTGFAVQRIVMPEAADFTPEERALIRAHEWEHIRRNDLGVRNLLAAVQCVLWFNPLVHAACAELRLDQELACDEAVVRRFGRRRLYAETLLKCHAAPPSPLGCHWLGRGAHPLEARLAALARRPVSEERRVLMAAFGLAAGLVSVAAAHATTPARQPSGPETRAQAHSKARPDLIPSALSLRN